MDEAFHALAISGSIMLIVVVFIVIVSMVAVKRGEAAQQEQARHEGKSH